MRNWTFVLLLATGCKFADGSVGIPDTNIDDNTSVDPTCDDLDQDGGCDVPGEDDTITGNATNPATMFSKHLTPGTVNDMWFMPVGKPCDTNDAHKVWTSDNVLEGYIAFNLNSADGTIAGTVRKPVWQDGKCVADMSLSAEANLAEAQDDDAIVWNDDPQPGVPDVFLCLEIDGTSTIPGNPAICQAQVTKAAEALNGTDGGTNPDSTCERTTFTWRFGFGPEVTNTTTVQSFTVKNVTTGEVFQGTRENISTVAVNITSCKSDVLDQQCYLSTDADPEAEDWCASNLHGGRIYNATGPTGTYTVGSAATNDMHYVDVDNGKHYQLTVK